MGPGKREKGGAAGPRHGGQTAPIKMAAAKLHMSMNRLIMDIVLKQAASIESLEKRGGGQP